VNTKSIARLDREMGRNAVRYGLLIAVALGVVFFAQMGRSEEAHQHHHPAKDAEIHELFYRNWMRPDHPESSCCNEKDCYPAEVRFRGGGIFAKQRESGNWVLVPPEKIEKVRDNPDGRNHICMSANVHAPQVFCLSLGAGG
jgi:hypothetical protein